MPKSFGGNIQPPSNPHQRGSISRQLAPYFFFPSSQFVGSWNRKWYLLLGLNRTMMDTVNVLHSKCWPQQGNIPTGIFVKLLLSFLNIQVMFLTIFKESRTNWHFSSRRNKSHKTRRIHMSLVQIYAWFWVCKKRQMQFLNTFPKGTLCIKWVKHDLRPSYSNSI